MKLTRKIYIVLHHEIFEDGEGFRDDEMVFFVVKRLRTALNYIKQCSVSPYSWWEIQEQRLDSQELPESLGHYGRRGGKLKSAPFERAIELFRSSRAESNRG